MRFAKRVLTLLTVASTMTFAQLAPEPQVADIPLMKDSTTNQPMKMDFSVPLTGISDPGILFSHFSNRPLLIYYFSPKCPHCQRHMPEIQDLMKEYEKDGLTGIAIGLGGGIKKNDIRMFIDQFHVVIPVFQDANGKFGPHPGGLPCVEGRDVLPLRDGHRGEHEPPPRDAQQDSEEVKRKAPPQV